MDLTQKVKHFALEQLGASVVGVTGIDRFEDAPRGHRPQDLLSEARSVVVLGVQLLESLAGWNRLFHDSEVYTTAETRMLVARDHFYARSGYETMNTCLEHFGLRTALFLERHGHAAMYLPATFAHQAPLMEKIPGYHAPFSHRHAAVRAGLGEFGLNNLVLTPEFGPRIRWMSVITRATLQGDALITRKICLGPSCSRCVETCGVDCLQPREDVDHTQVALDMPTRVDKQACFYKDGDDPDCWGRCIDVCPVGKRP
jgi:epoxyqueuosine reductase